MKKSLWALITVICMVLTGVTVYIASSFKTSEQKAAEAQAPEPSLVTANVEYRSLENTLPLVCSVDYSDQRELAIGNAESGAQYTSINIEKGEELKNGSLVAEVNGNPVFVLVGGFSFYRDLNLKDQGPDAKLLNDSLVSLGYQYPRIGADIDTVTEETYRALGVLYSNFGYKPLKKDDAIPTSSFIVLPEAATVISDPRSTGDVSSDALAQLSSGEKELACKPATGTLSPEVVTGQRLRLQAGSATTYPIEVKTEKDGSKANTAQGTAETGTSGQAGAGAQYVAVQVPENDLGEQTRFNVELILSASPDKGLVVPSSALYTTDQGDTVKLKVGENQTRDIAVRITYTANGYSMVEVESSSELAEGSQLVIQTGTSQ